MIATSSWTRRRTLPPARSRHTPKRNTRVILTNAAIGLEHLCKAYLCSLHPALLMEIKNGQLDSLLHLIGHSARAKEPSKGPRTISGRVAVERVQAVPRGITVPQDQVRQLIDVRDGVVHVGYLEEKETQQILASYVRLSDRLFEELKVPATDRWGVHQELVESLVSETLHEVEKDVRRRMARAKRHFDDLMSKIPEEQHAAVIKARQANSWINHADGADYADVTCPACGDDGASCFGREDVDVSVDVEPDGEGGYHSYIDGAWRFLQAESFACGACGLQLHNPDELEAAGLEITIDMPEGDDEDDERPYR
ncbi:hypothetical protein [Nonomuraea sp. SYSU D8015]|uniref:hypothetical protein n=1 Tax=Nonomuraea sp. SYSU D8015 TaxID=2593644 RepID=UPI0016608FFF|nr:hypothetical protein [Nonomuraea sp. SYSU D8015]